MRGSMGSLARVAPRFVKLLSTSSAFISKYTHTRAHRHTCIMILFNSVTIDSYIKQTTYTMF